MQKQAYTPRFESNYNDDYCNKNAKIVSRVDKNGKFRTETKARDSGTLNVAVSTDSKVNSTKLYLDFPGGEVATLNGREAKTLFRILSKHYSLVLKYDARSSNKHLHHEWNRLSILVF